MIAILSGMKDSSSPSDVQFALILVAIVCPITFLSVWMFGGLGALTILLVPLAFFFRASK